MAEDSQIASADPFAELVDETEIAYQLEIIQRLMESADADARRPILVDGLSKFGPHFVATIGYLADAAKEQAGPNSDFFAALQGEINLATVTWLKGDVILGTADEAERRARFALRVADQLPGLGRLVAKAILGLPAGDPLRDTERARKALLNHLEYAKSTGDQDGEILTITNLLDEKFADEATARELIERGERLLPVVEDGNGRDFLLSELSFHRSSRDAGGDNQPQIEALYERIVAMGGNEARRAKNLLLAAVVFDTEKKPSPVAEALRQARATGLLTHSTMLLASHLEAGLRFSMGEDSEVIDIVAPLIGAFEEAYLTAVEKSAIEDRGKTLTELTANLAFAQAALGRWREAAEALERGKSLRLRHQAALRLHSGGERLTELEGQLHALSRGVAATSEEPADPKKDRLGAEVSAYSRTLEEYRRTRAESPANLVGRTELRDIAAALQPDEIMLLLGISTRGTLAIGIRSGDGDQPSVHMLMPALTLEWLVGLLIATDREGWVQALQNGEALSDPRPALERLLAAVDEGLVAPVAAALSEAKIRRIVLVPHRFYHLVPLWAAPSFDGYDVSTVPSAAHFVASRGAARRPIEQALVVGDPTSDLPISPAETSAVREALTKIGVEVGEVAAEEAIETVLTYLVPRTQIFHFCGHARAELLKPMRAALLLAPCWPMIPVGGPDELDRLADGIADWRRIDDEERDTDIEGIGHLVEYRDGETGDLQRFLEYSSNGTLWMRYVDGRRVQAAELWTAGDLMVQRSFESCELAFLSACSTGAGGLGMIEETDGIPAALLLAGVSTIVATQWPVSDVLSALFVDLFYADLAAGAGHGPLDVTTVARKAAAALRAMTRDGVIARLDTIQRRVADPLVDFGIDAYKQKIASGEETPFSHPYSWASFHVLGRGDIVLSATGGKA
jgi:hypothetical protein